MSRQQELLIQQIRNTTYEKALKLIKEHDEEIKDKAYEEGYHKGYNDYDPDGWIM